MNTQDRGQWTSASAAEADGLCAGRHQAQRGLPEIKSADADRGNRSHAALAAGKPDGLILAELELYDACQKIERDTLAKFFGPEILSSKAVPVIEQRLWIKNASGLQHSGQPDRIYRKGVRLLIVDYKSGHSEVAESPRNPQLRDLAVLADKNSVMVQEIGVVIIQPLVTHTPEICLYDCPALKQAALELEARVKASNDPAAKRTPGEVQCKYCRATGICKEYQKWATTGLPVPVSLVDVPLADWTPVQFGMFLERLPIAQKWLDAAYDRAKELAIAGTAIPGFTLRPGTVKQTITEPQTVFDRFSDKGGTLAQFMACIAVGKTKFKEALAKVTGTKGKALDTMLDAILEGCVEEKQNAPSLVKEKV